MLRRHQLPRMSIAAIAAAVLVCAASVTIAAPAYDSTRTSGYRRAIRAGVNPKQPTPRYGDRPGTVIGSNSIDGPYDLLMDAGTVFTIRNAMDPYRSADMIYAGPDVDGLGTSIATPVPGAALLAALGLSFVGFVRRRVGIESAPTNSPE